jgi:hypothetical protein
MYVVQKETVWNIHLKTNKKIPKKRDHQTDIVSNYAQTEEKHRNPKQYEWT